MIISLFIYMIATTLNAAVFWLPTGEGIPAAVESNFMDLAVAAMQWEYYFPVTTFFSVLLVIATAHLALFGWKGLKYIVALIRGN